MFLCGVPLTPDEGEARSWLEEELSRPEYNTDSSIFGRIVSTLQDLLDKALSWDGVEGAAPPIELVLLLAGIVAIAGIAIALILNPIRRRSRSSHAVFEDASTSEDARAALDGALAANDWNLAYVWSYRLLVLGLDAAEVVSATPGLTAREAAAAATSLVPSSGQQLSRHAATFDRVRYGHCAATRQDVEALRELTQPLVDECQRAKERA